MTDAFFEVHKDLPREGPGEPADIDWAMGLIRPAPDAAICDAGSGPGGDVPALLAHVPEGRVVAVDTHAPFIEQARTRFAGEPRVEPRVGDFSALGGPFDVIWCAGALYFLGVGEGLRAFRPALAEGGAVAFSYPCHFTDAPSDTAVAFWAEEGLTAPARDDLFDQVRAAGFEPLGDRPIGPAAWEAYYGPMEARIARLRPGAGPDLSKALDEAEAEIAAWRAIKDETGYLLIVARPV